MGVIRTYTGYAKEIYPADELYNILLIIISIIVGVFAYKNWRRNNLLLVEFTFCLLACGALYLEFYMLAGLFVVGFLVKKFTSLRKTESPSGLSNTSETCYMNSMIQAVASHKTFIEELKDLRGNKLFQCRGRNQCKSVEIFINLLEGVNQPFAIKCNLVDTFLHRLKQLNKCEMKWFENVIRYLNGKNQYDKRMTTEINTQLMGDLMKSISWNKRSQQDVYDLFAALIKAIHNEFKQSKGQNVKMPMKVKLVHRFHNMGIPDKCQDHLGLSIGLCGPYSERPGVDLEYLIEQYFSPTNIDDDPDKTTQMFFYQEAPNILLLHIQANKWDSNIQEMIKPEYYIKYDEEISLNLNIVTDLGVEETRKETVRYKLKAIVKHMGKISGGHYVTYRECSEGWFLVSDEQVEQMPFDSSIVPYVLIYEKLNNQET